MSIIDCSMREALASPDVFGHALPGDSWAAWRAVLIAARGEPLTAEEREVFRELSLREREPDQPCKEVWAIVGRRGGKTRALSVLGAYMAVCIDYDGRLAPGQRAQLPIVAAVKKQANEALNYILGIFEEGCEDLRGMVDGEPIMGTIRLRNRVDITVYAADKRTVRSSTNVAVIADEMALWRGENAANPDKEVLRALRPGGATLGAPLFVLSSPYAKRGELWDSYKRDYGPDGDPRILVIKAPTLRMHNSDEVREEYELELRRDPQNAKAEYGAEFRDTVSDFIDPDTVAACTDDGIVSRPYDRTIGTYSAFMDASGGGTGKDAMTLAIAHRTGDTQAALDHIEVVEPPVVPDVACAKFAEVLRRYNIWKVTGDNYAGAWPATLMLRNGINFEKSEKNKNQIYLDFVALLNSGLVRLLDHDKMRKQLLNLERKTKQGGRDEVDHPSGGHDDAINSAAGALCIAAFRPVSLQDLL